jgi:hypothetical protein
MLELKQTSHAAILRDRPVTATMFRSWDALIYFDL